MIHRADYPHPVCELIDRGPLEVEADDIDCWFDYVGHYGLEEIDVPPLIDLMGEQIRANPRYPYERYAPIHACRALAQIGDMVAEDYFRFLVENGQQQAMVKNAAAALTVLAQSNLKHQHTYFNYPNIKDVDRIGIVETVWQLAQRFPTVRDECVAFLSERLSEGERYSHDLNGFFVLGLVKLKATEASALIEQAITSGQANDEMNGSWAAIQVKLGLASESDFTPDRLLCARDRQKLIESNLAIMMPKKDETA